MDDEMPVRIALEKLVDWKSYGIDTLLNAANGKEGLELMRLHEPELVFLDICMPIMNGLEFLEQAKDEYPCSQFIIVSGYDDFHYAQNALHFGATDYLLKPLDKELLLKAIEHAIKKHALEVEVQRSTDSALSSYSSLNAIGSGANSVQDLASQALSPDEIAGEIHDYIDKNYAENIRISMFSEKYFFTKEYISRTFKNRFHIGIYEYVLNVRMESAARLLQDSSIKIQDVGSRVGFRDNNYFSKAFKNYFGLSPSDYRQKTK